MSCRDRSQSLYTKWVWFKILHTPFLDILRGEKIYLLVALIVVGDPVIWHILIVQLKKKIKIIWLIYVFTFRNSRYVQPINITMTEFILSI